MDRIFKYQTHIESALLKNCPPDSAVEQDMTAFRFAHYPPRESNFLPRALGAPPRILRDDRDKCLSFALSMFQSQASAQKVLRMANDNFHRFVWDCIVQVSIRKHDGKATEPQPNGHFSFFEYVSFDPRAKCRSVTQQL